MKITVNLGKIVDKDCFGYGLDVFLSTEKDGYNALEVKNPQFIQKKLLSNPEEFCLLELGKGGSFLNANSIKECKYSFNVKNGDVIRADFANSSFLITLKDYNSFIVKRGSVYITDSYQCAEKMFSIYGVPKEINMDEAI